MPWLILIALGLVGYEVAKHYHPGATPTGPTSGIPVYFNSRPTGRSVKWTAERNAVLTFGPRFPNYWDQNRGSFVYLKPDGVTVQGYYTPVTLPAMIN